MNRLASPAQLRASLLRWALFCVPAVMLLGYMSGVISGSAADNPWFAALEKPALYPPPIAFPIAWTLLYFLMGLALAMVASAWGARWQVPAIIAFVLQLALNLAWSPVFFGAHELTAALVIILAMDVAVAITLWLFWKVRPMAALLLLPYLAWILFATTLTYEIRALNPEMDGAMPSNAVQRIEL